MSLEEQFSDERAWRKGPGIPDGADVERALFGSPTVSRKEKHEGYMSFDHAIEFVKAHQPDILERSRIVRDLSAKVSMLCNDTAASVKFFTAVGTPLDIYHGVDAFFQQGRLIVTVDVSLQDKEDYKADVLIVATLDKEGIVSVSDNEMARGAEKIAMLLNVSPKPN